MGDRRLLAGAATSPVPRGARRRLLRDRVVLIAGVGPGLGAALAERVVDHGGRVVLTARSADRLAELRDRLGDAALDLAADLRDEDAVRQVVTGATRHFGR